MKIDFACTSIDADDLFICAYTLTRAELSILKSSMDGVYRNVKDYSDLLGLERSGVQKALHTLVSKDIFMRRQINHAHGGYSYTYALRDKDSFIKETLSRIEAWNIRAQQAIKTLSQR